MELPSVEASKQGWKGYNPMRSGHPEEQAKEYLERKNGPRLKIDDVTLFVSVDEFGDEGVTAFHTGWGWMPMVAADEARIKSLRDVALEMSRDQRIVIREIKFSTKTVVKTFDKGQVS